MRKGKAIRCALALLALGVALELAAPARAGEMTESTFDKVPDNKRGLADVDDRSDVSPVTKDYAAAGDVIVHQIDELVPALTERARPRRTLRGVIMAIDERNDRLTVRLASDATGDFRVQDALIFDAVHTGDAVELTVENIAGAKTIVELTIE